MNRERDEILAAYDDGVQAVEACAGRITRWSAPSPCEQWQAVDLAGHLLAISRYYHELLDAAEAGHPRSGLPTGHALAAMNARELIGLRPGQGPDRISTFLRVARHYGRRLAKADWDATLGEWDGVGPRTVAQHTGLAIAERHIHAWDLAQSAGHDHRPAHAEAVAGSRSLLGGRPPEGDPWLATLIGSGRSPAAADDVEHIDPD